MREHAVEAVGCRRTGRAAGGVVGAKHEVVDDQLRPAVEQLRKSACAGLGVEAVLLFESHPRELAALLCDLVGEPRVLLLAREQRRACGEPVFTCSDLGHAVTPFTFQGPMATVIPSATIASATEPSTARRSGRSFWARTS